MGRVNEMRRQYGVGSTCQWVAARAAKRLLRVELSRMVCLEISHLPQVIEGDPEFTFRPLTVNEITQLAADPAYELAGEFVERAANNLELCFAALHYGETVAHYGWYATGAIGGEHHMGVPMLFPDDVAYMYNAFTHPAYRGRRLHGTATALAARSLSARGITRLVSTIETTNFASLRSFHHMGFMDIGSLLTIGQGNPRWSFNPKAARSLGIRFGREAAPAAC